MRSSGYRVGTRRLFWVYGHGLGMSDCLLGAASSHGEGSKFGDLKHQHTEGRSCRNVNGHGKTGETWSEIGYRKWPYFWDIIRELRQPLRPASLLTRNFDCSQRENNPLRMTVFSDEWNTRLHCVECVLDSAPVRLAPPHQGDGTEHYIHL